MDVCAFSFVEVRFVAYEEKHNEVIACSPPLATPTAAASASSSASDGGRSLALNPRFRRSGSYSNYVVPPNAPKFVPGSLVVAQLRGEWREGVVSQVDEAQVQVDERFWCHIGAYEIFHRPSPPAAIAAAAKSPAPPAQPSPPLAPLPSPAPARAPNPMAAAGQAVAALAVLPPPVVFSAANPDRPPAHVPSVPAPAPAPAPVPAPAAAASAALLQTDADPETLRKAEVSVCVRMRGMWCCCDAQISICIGE
jgi:hypothetical protein